MDKKKLIKMKLPMVLFLLMLFCFIPSMKVNAATASAVSFGTIDYDKLTMQVYYNNNTVVYYSTDNSTWSEVEGAYDSSSKSYVMDISWASSTSDVTLYFKGDIAKTIKMLTLPAQNTSFDVDYDKVDGTFTFDNAEEADSFEWRKVTDYNWTTVSMEETFSSYHKFINKIETFKTSGAEIVIRIPQVAGTGMDNTGMRPSQEIKITIPARTVAPTVKVNSSKLTVNTTTSMEYYDSTSALWIECTGTMSLEEIAPKVLYENGAASTTLRIRKAATTSAPYSKTQYLRIASQVAAPMIGDSSADVTYYYMNSKLMLQFNKATATNVYEYTIVRSSSDFNVATASWKTVNKSDVLTISSSTAPNGCTVYVRKKGTDADEDDNVSLVLASAMNSFTINY